MENQGKLSYPLDQNDQKILEQTRFQELHGLKIVGGLPYYSAVREITINKPTQAETWIENISGSMYIASYINGVKYQWKQL
jgi:hypothetical protein